MWDGKILQTLLPLTSSRVGEGFSKPIPLPPEILNCFDSQCKFTLKKTYPPPGKHNYSLDFLPLEILCLPLAIFFSVQIDFIFLFGANNCRRFVYIFMIYWNSFNANLKIPTTEILTLTNITHNNLPYINHDTLNWIFTFYDLCIYVAMRFVIIQIFIAFSCAPFCCVIFRFMENVVLSKLRHTAE